MVAVASSGADSFITEGQVEEEVAHGLVGVPRASIWFLEAC